MTRVRRRRRSRCRCRQKCSARQLVGEEGAQRSAATELYNNGLLKAARLSSSPLHYKISATFHCFSVCTTSNCLAQRM